jgi:hypothetical protein
MGLKLHLHKTQIVNTKSGFQFIGFSINHIWKWCKVKTLITLSRESCQRFLEEIRWAIQLSKGKAAYQLITILVRHLIETWYATSEYLKQEMNPKFRMIDPLNPTEW